MRYYRLDLRTVLWGPDVIGLRRLRALVVNLPADAALFLHFQSSKVDAPAEGNGHVVTTPDELNALVNEWNGAR